MKLTAISIQNELTSFSLATYMERATKIHVSLNSPHLLRAIQSPLPYCSTYSSRHSARFTSLPQMLLYCDRSWLQHACQSCVSAKAYQDLPASSSGCSEMGISKCLGLTETLPEMQFLQLQQANASHKLLGKMQRKACQTPTPASNSAWKTEQSLDPEQSGFTYCQSFCAVLWGSPAQSDQPLSS